MRLPPTPPTRPLPTGSGGPARWWSRAHTPMDSVRSVRQKRSSLICTSRLRRFAVLAWIQVGPSSLRASSAALKAGATRAGRVFAMNYTTSPNAATSSRLPL